MSRPRGVFLPPVAAPHGGAAVTSVAGRSGDVVLGEADVASLAADLASKASATMPLGGDLSGTLPSPTVAKLNGVAISGAPTAGQVVTATGPSAAAWQTPSAGFADPTTTKGDLIVHGAQTARLPVGADGTVLTADSGQASGVRWAAALGDGAWTTIGSAGAPAFANGWQNFGGGYAAASFRKDGQGFVHLMGMIKSGGQNTTCFTLPAGYRPLASLSFATAVGGSNAGNIGVNPDGTVVVWFGNGSNTDVRLDGITFLAEA